MQGSTSVGVDGTSFPSLEDKLLLLGKQRAIQQERSQRFFEHITWAIAPTTKGDRRGSAQQDDSESNSWAKAQRQPQLSLSPRDRDASPSHPYPAVDLAPLRTKLPRPRCSSSFIERLSDQGAPLNVLEETHGENSRTLKSKSRRSAPMHSRSTLQLEVETSFQTSHVDPSGRPSRQRRTALSGPCDVGRARRRVAGAPSADLRRRSAAASWSGTGLTGASKSVGAVQPAPRVPLSPSGAAARRVPGSGCRLPHDDVYRDTIDFSDDDSSGNAAGGRVGVCEGFKGLSPIGSWKESRASREIDTPDWESSEDDQLPSRVKRGLSCEGATSEHSRCLSKSRSLFSSCEERSRHGSQGLLHTNVVFPPPFVTAGSRGTPEALALRERKLTEGSPFDHSLAEQRESSRPTCFSGATALTQAQDQSVDKELEQRTSPQALEENVNSQPVLSMKGHVAGVGPLFSDYSASEACTSSASDCEASVRGGTRFQAMATAAAMAEGGEREREITRGRGLSAAREHCQHPAEGTQVLNAAQLIMARKLRPVSKPCAVVFSDYVSTDYNTSSASESEATFKFDVATSRFMQSGLVRVPWEVSSSGSG